MTTRCGSDGRPITGTRDATTGGAPMMASRALYDTGYRLVRMPWEIGPRKELVHNGRLQPCRVADLGCGTGANSVFLAEQGFDVTGIDFSPAALANASNRAAQAGVTVQFVEDDLTALRARSTRESCPTGRQPAGELSEQFGAESHRLVLAHSIRTVVRRTP